MPPEVVDALGGVTVLQMVVWGGVAIAVLVGLYKAWPWIRKAVRTIDALAELPDHMVTTTQRLDRIEGHVASVRHEVFPNGGNSLRDRVDQVADWQVKHEQKSDAAVARIDALERKKES